MHQIQAAELQIRTHAMRGTTRRIPRNGDYSCVIYTYRGSVVLESGRRVFLHVASSANLKRKGDCVKGNDYNNYTLLMIWTGDDTKGEKPTRRAIDTLAPLFGTLTRITYYVTRA
jgi:hypothetical protein